MMSRFLFCCIFSFCVFCSSLSEAKSVVLFGKECENQLVELINATKKTLDISVYSINNQRLVEAVINAHKRGVKIRILTDKVQAAGRSSRVEELRKANLVLRVHTHKRIMHTKVAIYDGVSVSSGSFNWTEPAVLKNEEVCDIFIQEPEYTAQHQALFENRWEKNTQLKSDLWFEKRAQKLLEKKKKEEAEKASN